MATDHELRVHRDWIGLLQPVGLVVSPPALNAAQAFPNKDILKEQQTLLALLTPPAPKDEAKRPPDGPSLPLGFEALATQVLGWKASKLAGSPHGPALSENLELVLPEFGETLRPTYAVPALEEDEAEWMMLVQELADGTSLDEPPAEETKKWHASPQVRLERLLRETGVPIGILANGRFVRLVYAPRGESSGHITWPVHRLCTALDRDMLSALCMLLSSARLFAMSRDQRLPHILQESRKYQNVVSTKLAGQVLEALNELLRGFQSANEAAKGGLLDATVREDPNHIYGGLLAVLLRLVFILYAEERGLLSSSAAYVRNYSLVGLFDKLRLDAGRFPDTMDQRYGAWSRLLVLFRMVHDGAKRGELRLPPRYGHLFDPDGWAFLEGRPYRVNRVMGAPVAVPKVPDGVVLRVLEKLLLLDSDRLSYRTLDVEQIGSVYENMMGFRLETALEMSIGVGKEHVVIGLETLLAQRGTQRENYLKEAAGVALTGKAAAALKEAASIDDLVAALGRRLSPLTPRTVPVGGLYLQPTDERRRSGSHYTPRELTEPLVRTTLRPILDDLGSSPTPAQILALKVCDPAAGSGAILVESCRQIAEQLVKAYDVHGRPTDVPPDEDLLLYAQRQVAQHCLYGVDKNPFAVDLAKLSLWLVTLARDHAFTFLDHSIRHGDSLVGLTREQIASFHWAPEAQIPMISTFVERAIAEAMELRARIPELANSDDVGEKRRLLQDADEALARVRMIGDAIVVCFFEEDKPKARDTARRRWESQAPGWLSDRGVTGEVTDLIEDLRSGEKSVPCFHWEFEFPEVFGREAPGFDVIVGNPPFLGSVGLAHVHRQGYTDWLRGRVPGSGGKTDIVAYFFRRAYGLLRVRGVLGLLATKSIRQGDNRRSGLQEIRRLGGRIIAATRRIAWPGQAAVVVSAIHIRKGASVGTCELDGRTVTHITPYLLGTGPDDETVALFANRSIAFLGCKPGSPAFIFDDRTKGAMSEASYAALLAVAPPEVDLVRGYLGGEDILSNVPPGPRRLIHGIGFAGAEETAKYPHTLELLRESLDSGAKGEWWKFARPAKEMYERIANLKRVIVRSETSSTFAFEVVSSRLIFSNTAIVFAVDGMEWFALLQSRVHETWATFFGSSMKDDLRYVPAECFDSFPLPNDWPGGTPNLSAVHASGDRYREFRHELILRRRESLTDLSNRLNDPSAFDGDLMALRSLHDALDRAVLDAYGWFDIRPTCQFLLDYEESAEEGEPSGGRARKKPWRYRWPDDVRDEVLALLLELNAKRAKEQAGTPPRTGPGAPSAADGKACGRAKGAEKLAVKNQGGLFEEETK